MTDFFDFSNEMLCVADSRGVFIRLNPAWSKTLGWSLEEMINRPYIEFVHPNDVEATIRESMLLQTENYETIEFMNRYVCKDGTYRWFAWRAKAMPESGEVIAAARDVTELIEQNAALRDSEQRLRSLIMNAPVGIVLADAEGRTTFANSQLCQMIGVDAEQIMDFRWQQLIHPDDLHNVLTHWQQHLKAGINTPPFEFRFHLADESIHWVRGSVSVLKDEDNQVTGQIVSVEDIHDSKIAEQRLWAIFEQSPLGIAVLDSRTNRFLQVNPKLAEILGRSVEEILQLDFQSVTHADDLPADLDYMQALVRGEIRQFRMEKRYLKPDGSHAWVNLTVVPMWDVGEAPGIHLAMVEDITQQKRSEEKISSQDALMRGLLEHTPAVVYVKDREGRHVVVNERFEKIFRHLGVPAQNLTSFEIFPEPIASQVHAFDEEVWASQQAIVKEETVLQAEGQRTYRSVKFPIKDASGRMVALGGISTDISDLARAYQYLQTQQELLRNLIDVQEKEKQFICYEFHDGLIQYAAGSLMTLEAFLEQNPEVGADTPITDAIANLRIGVQEGRRVIRGIRPTVLDDMGVDAAIEDLVDQMSGVDIEIATRFTPNLARLPRELEATIYRLAQEALNNVRKHADATHVTIRLLKEGKSLRLEVEDNGTGFEYTPSESHGFGLLGMQERVRLLEGELTIESSPGVGTKISAIFPLP